MTEVWLPVLRGLLDRAHDAQRLRPGVSPEDAVALLAHLAEGAMAAHGATRDSAWDAVWDSVWNVVLHGLAADRTGQAGQADRTGQAGQADRTGRTDAPGPSDATEPTDATDLTECGAEPS